MPPSVAGGQRFAERLSGEGAGDDLSDVLAEQMTGFASGEQVAGGEVDLVPDRQRVDRIQPRHAAEVGDYEGP